jgi:hypothetical protein
LSSLDETEVTEQFRDRPETKAPISQDSLGALVASQTQQASSYIRLSPKNLKVRERILNRPDFVAPFSEGLAVSHQIRGQLWG